MAARAEFVGWALMGWLACVAVVSVEGAEAVWHPAQAPLMTRWAKSVARGQTHSEYPRPQMVRNDWLNLNGLWDCAVTSRGAPQPTEFPERILVPFPVESALSGLMLTNLDEKKRIWYRRKVALPATWLRAGSGQRLLLHFGAVDFEATVFVNGKQVGQHRGGYDPFSFDITDALLSGEQNNDKEQELVVAVWDPTDAVPNPRGKQVRRPDKGIFYTASSGIWQTVWLEPVPATSIESVKILPDIDAGGVRVTVTVRGEVKKNEALDVVVTDAGGGEVASSGGAPGGEIFLKVPRAKLWTPDSPYLYSIAVTWERTITEDNVVPLDKVNGYFGMRKVALGQHAGATKLFLNNEPFFMIGPLDQGFWPDGLYTAPSDEALRYDIEITKKLGFNMARKHVKVEPERWYYWCDKLGLLVWQDMPSGDRSINPRDADITRSPESSAQFERELKAMIDARYNHPCIVMWVVFNEGWGQYDTARLTKWTSDYDPSRLVNNASGWADRGVGDVMDMHRYPGPGSPPPESKRAAVLGEFGGLGFKVDNHTWAGQTWGYRGMESIAKLTRQYVKLLRGVYALKEKPGLSAAVYTQTTDVEYEGNGLLTYDREVVKMAIDAVAAANRGQFPPEPKLVVLSPTAQADPVLWHYTTNRPPEAWATARFDASNWAEGPGGFGTKGTPGAVVRTEWRSADIWLRHDFNLADTKFDDLRLSVHHDEDAEVYLNGVLALKTQRYISDYDDFDITPEARKALHAGQNVLAVHCHQTTGGQYIDVGLVNYVPPSP